METRIRRNMAFIQLNNSEPGIRGLFMYRQDTAGPMSLLADFLLRGPNTLTEGERELIATLVSDVNECGYCRSVHGAVAAAHFGLSVDEVGDMPVSQKMMGLLKLAGMVAKNAVDEDDVTDARRGGATDREIHDTVLIASAFCMFNRYVSGLGTLAPTDPDWYAERGKILAKTGYLAAIKTSVESAG
jgi:AhpD family alkylhydroperoxidase